MSNIIFRNIILVVISSALYLIFISFSYSGFNTADASLYLSTAENIAGHKGFVVSYNLYQQFNTLYHPVFPYYQPVYSLFASLFIGHGGIVKVVQVNILLFVFNVLLIYYLIQKLIPTRFNILFILFLAFSYDFYVSALYAWTEQLYFLCFIITFILFLKYSKSPRHLVWLGALNGVLMLVRVAHFYNFAGFLPLLFFGEYPLRQKFNKAFSFIGGFILAFGLYQLFCLAAYHAFYPECPRPAMDYSIAHHTSGIIYHLNTVGIQVLSGPFLTLGNLLNMAKHCWGFYLQMPLLLWPVLICYSLGINRKKDGGFVELCFFQSLITIFGYSLTFCSVAYFSKFEFIRYSLLPYALLSLAGWYCLYQGLTLSYTPGKKLLGWVLMISLLIPQVRYFTLYYETYSMKHPIWRRPYFSNLLESYRWIDNNLPKEVLVASSDDQENYFMHRPFVSLPPGRSFNCTNLALYNQIYAPDYYLLSRLVPDKCFTLIPHTAVYSNKTFRLYKVSK